MSTSRPVPAAFDPAKRFVLATALVLAACAVVMRTQAFANNPDLGYFGIAFDLCITVPALYYWLVIRAGRARALTIVPVLIGSTLVARWIIPVAHQEFVRQLLVLQVVGEVAVVAAIARRLHRMRCSAGDAETDLVARAERVCCAIFGETRVARFVAAEVVAVYLGLFGWRVSQQQSDCIASTTFHRKSGWGSIVVCVLVLIAAESLAVHLLLQQWSSTIAWIVTGLDGWGALWLLGDYHAFRIRPTLVTRETLELRFGSRWSATIPREAIESVEPISATDAERRRGSKDYLRLSILEEPSHLITLREPVTVRGIAGITRMVTSIGIRPDDEAVVDALRSE